MVLLNQNLSQSTNFKQKSNTFQPRKAGGKGERLKDSRRGEGIEFTSHEPPLLNHQPIRIPRGITEEMGLVFEHYAFSLRPQVEFKEQFYGYAGLTQQWEELNKTHGPVRLNKYFHHVQDRSVVDDST